LSTLAAALERLGEGRRAIPHMHGAAGRLTDIFLDAAQRLTATLEADDNPDVMRLSADFLRLDVLAMALEELDAKHELTEAATAMAALTTLVMGKINSLLNACIHDNDGFARFGVSVMLNDVEDLIDIARRALEGGLIGGVSADLTGRGAAQVAEFIRLAGQFADLSLEELRGGLDEQASGMTAAAFTAKLRPIGALYRFAARLPAEAAKNELAALTRLLHRRVAAMVLALADMDAGPGRGERLTALFDLADGLGWREVAAAAVRLLRG
ncbi:MAG TPA: serine/threonine protein kinase, partial [Azospirillaceae bacterium]|nr:serine/threonine protein kinase [Azospirillaceae bacterium]